MSKPASKKEKTKRKIIQCFWELFRQKSIDKITVSELTSLLGINRSTFYAYFKDIYDVLDAIEEHYLPDGVMFLKKCPDIKDKEQVYQTFLKIFDENYENFTFLLSERGDPNFVIKLKNSIRPVFRQSIPMEYQQNKYFDLSMEFILSSMISVITYWANHTTDITSRELFDHLHNLYVFGIPLSLGITINEDAKHKLEELTH